MNNSQRTYYSYYDIPVDNIGSDTSAGLKSGMQFSRREIIHIIIAMATLTVAFSFALSTAFPPITDLGSAFANMPLSFLAIATAFFCHELAHKYMGQKYGYWSEFRMFPQGLLIALFLGIAVGVVFAVPGAVHIFGRPTNEESGKMATAGPAMNIMISVLCFLPWLFSGGYLKNIFFFIASINAFLAVFNLLPFDPLDGMKIFRWKKTMWGLLIAASIGILAILWL